MANVSSNNLTTLYSGGGVNVRPTSAYGNANVVALLNVGTDGGNTVTNILATGNMTIGNITANGNVTADYFIGNVIGNIANANFANFANVANIANSANSVAVANVVGIGNIAVINLDGNVSNILHGNGYWGPESGNLNANFANFAGNVTNSAQPNITSLGTLTGLTSNGTVNFANAANVNLGSNSNVHISGGAANYALITDGAGNLSWGQVANAANANYSNYAGTLINGTSNVTIPVANGNITFSANGVANLAVLDTTGNLTVNNEIIAQSANLAGSYDILSIGTYYPMPLEFSNIGSPNVQSFYINGDFTSGSNLITNVTLYDGFAYSPISLSAYATELNGKGIAYTNGQAVNNDTYIPLLTTITSVDGANNQIYMSNNATLSGTSVNYGFTGVWLSNSASNSYWMASQPFVTDATSTDSTSNSISVTDFGLFNDGFINPGDFIQFYGTSFGNITAGADYYVSTIDYGNSTFTISTTNGGPDVALTTATGVLNIVLKLASLNVQPLGAGYYYAGPWDNLPVLANLTQTPSGYISGGTTITTNGYFVKPVDFNYGQTPPVVYSGQYTRVDNGLVISDGSYGTPTLTGVLNSQSPVNGVTLLHTGLDANISGSRTNYQIVDYTENSSGAANITNPLNPPAFSFTSYNGNVNSDPNDQYARSGRTLGRVAWYGSQQVGGVKYDIPGSSPHAGIYVQALGDWNDSTNANLPMTMSFQYSPLNAATGGGSSYQRINRTFLQASNNSTYIGGATNIQFKPLARSGSGTNNRSPSALGNSSINPQTFVDIGGYTPGDAVSNGAGAVLNVTTTASSWDGNVALRLTRTVGNTGNMEFVLPQASSNTLLLVDNASGNTVATFTDGNVNLGNLATANFFQGDGGLLSNIVVSGGTAIVNGNTSVIALANSNVTFDVAGVSNVIVVTNSGAIVNGTMTANFFSGDGSNLTNIVAAGGNANYANYAGNLINGTSNVSIPTANGNVDFNINGNANLVRIETTNTINTYPLSTAVSALRINTIGGSTGDAHRVTWARSRGTLASPTSVQAT